MELIEKEIVSSSCSPSARIFPQHSYVWSIDLSIRSSIRPCLPASIYPSFPICLSVHAPAAPESYRKCVFVGGECSSVHPLLDTLSQMSRKDGPRSSWIYSFLNSLTTAEDELKEPPFKLSTLWTQLSLNLKLQDGRCHCKGSN